jgi:hypothetical protein
MVSALYSWLRTLNVGKNAAVAPAALMKSLRLNVVVFMVLSLTDMRLLDYMRV